MGGRIGWVSFDEIGRDCLRAAAGVGADVAGIVTLPEDLEPKPSGWCSFRDEAATLGAELVVTTDVNADATVSALARIAPDVVFVVGWSQLVREAFLAIPSGGVFGMHPTLLPKHRGRAPIPWAILSGLTKTGVTLFEIGDPTADSGAVVAQIEVPIAERETAASLYARLARAHVELIEKHLAAVLDGTAPRRPQDVTRASEWPRRRPSDGIIDWATRVPALDAWIRAQTRPYPGAFSFLGDAKVTIWQARPLGTGEGPAAGTVVAAADDGVEVRCGDGSILLEEVDLEEVGNLHGAAIGEHLRPGTVLG